MIQTNQLLGTLNNLLWLLLRWAAFRLHSKVANPTPTALIQKNLLSFNITNYGEQTTPQMQKEI